MERILSAKRGRQWLTALAWVVAAAWVAKTAETWLRIGEVPDLLSPGLELGAGTGAEAGGGPELAVVVPALNEEAAISDCLLSLLGSQGVRLEIVAVNDRSTDRTGEVMDRVAGEAAQGGHSLRVLHIEQLPAGWLGKPHALSSGYALTSAPYVLFTDADAIFSPDALARALAYVRREQADHFVLMPTPILKTPGEQLMMGTIQTFSMWGVRLWKIADPGARDYLGVGCFNLLRREAYEQVGGFPGIRMEVLEDLRLGFLVKQHGLRQRVATGYGLLRLHWAPGALGIVRTLTKNLFAVWRYRLVLAAGAFLGLSLMTLAPVAVLLLGSAPEKLPSALAVATILAAYAVNAWRTRTAPWLAVFYPVSTALFLYAMVRSTAITLCNGGVEWRGTLYPLRDLRLKAGRLW